MSKMMNDVLTLITLNNPEEVYRVGINTASPNNTDNNHHHDKYNKTKEFKFYIALIALIFNLLIL